MGLKKTIISRTNTATKKAERAETTCVVCIRNDGYPASLERNKIYRTLPDPEAARDGDLRVIDESGEDYLYPADWFVAIRVPQAVEMSLAQTA